MMQAFLAVSLYIYTKMRKSKETPVMGSSNILFSPRSFIKNNGFNSAFFNTGIRTLSWQKAVFVHGNMGHVSCFQLSVFFVWLYVRFGTIIYGTTAAYMGNITERQTLINLMTQFKKHLFYYPGISSIPSR
jgi:hypothetical protein